MPKAKKEALFHMWKTLIPVMKKRMIRLIAGILFIPACVFHARNDLLCVPLMLFELILFILGELKRPRYKREEIFGAILFSLFQTIGNVEGWDLASTAPTFNFGTFRYLFFSFIGYFFFFRSFIALVFIGFRRMHTKINSPKQISKPVFLLLFTLLGVLCYLPYFLANYPALINADGWWQIEQANGYQPLNNWLSVIYTLILRLLYSFGFLLFHNANAAIGTISVFSMFFMAFLFAQCIYIAYKNGLGKKGIGILALFYYGCPFNGLYAITIWKDTFFGGALLLLVTLLFDAIKNEKKDLKTLILLGLNAFFVCTLRSNGLYALVVTIPFLLFFLKGSRKEVAIVSAAVLLSVGLFNGPIQSALKVEGDDPIEPLSIPIQEVGYTITMNGNISRENETAISEIADIDLFSNYYIPYISDDLKDLIRSGATVEGFRENEEKYKDLWLSIGKDNPVYYVKGYALQTRGNYYFSNAYYWKYLTGITTPNEPSDGYYRDPVCSASLSEGIMNFAQFFDENIYSKVWSISLTNWSCILLFLYLIQRKNKAFLSILPCIFVSGTLMLATPVSQEFRYSYGMFLSLPLLLALTASTQPSLKKKKATTRILYTFVPITIVLILLLNVFPFITKERNTYVLTVIDKDEVETEYTGKTDATTLEELLNQRVECGDFSYTAVSSEEGTILSTVNEETPGENAKWAVKIDYGDSIYTLEECTLPEESYITIWLLYEYE